MKRLSIFLGVVLTVGLVCPADASWGKTVGRLEVYLHHEYFPDCRFPLTRGEPDLLINVDKNGRLVGPIIASSIPLNVQCGDCRFTGRLVVHLVDARIKKVNGKKMLDFSFVVDGTEAKWECKTEYGTFTIPLQQHHPDSLLQGEKSSFTIPWKNDHFLSMPGMMVHFILRVTEK